MMRGSLVICLLVLGLALGCGQKSSDNLASTGNGPTPPNPGPNEPPTGAELVQADVRHTLNAVYGGDLETVLKFTHPKIIEQLGGPAQAKTTLQNTLNQVSAAGMKIESLTFPATPRFTNSAIHDFAVVPTKLVLFANGQRVESLNYQFGVREVAQTNWTYIEGSRISTENVRTFFPDFPSGFEFPRVYRKKL